MHFRVILQQPLESLRFLTTVTWELSRCCFSCVVLKSQVGEFCDKSFGFVLFFTYFLKLVLFAIPRPIEDSLK